MWAIALAAGFTAGLVSWLGGELTHEAFKPQLFKIKIAFTTFIQPTAASLNTADLKNASLVFTILGGVTGAVMGIAGGIAGRSLSRGLIVGFGTLLAGSLVGTLTSLALLPIYFRQSVPDPNDLMSPIMIHGGIWMAIGAVGGLAFALGMGCGRVAFNAIVGACFWRLDRDAPLSRSRRSPVSRFRVDNAPCNVCGGSFHGCHSRDGSDRIRGGQRSAGSRFPPRLQRERSCARAVVSYDRLAARRPPLPARGEGARRAGKRGQKLGRQVSASPPASWRTLPRLAIRVHDVTHSEPIRARTAVFSSTISLSHCRYAPR